MKSTAAFKALSRNRRDRKRAQTNWVAVSLKKDGTPRKVMRSDLDHGFATQDQADAECSRLEKLNPGRRFAAVQI